MSDVKVQIIMQDTAFDDFKQRCFALGLNYKIIAGEIIAQRLAEGMLFPETPLEQARYDAYVSSGSEGL